MKTTIQRRKRYLLLLAPLFLQAVCSKDDELPVPATDEYITWKIPGHNGNLTTPPGNVAASYPSAGAILFTGFTSSGNDAFYALFAGAQSPGTYSSSYFNVYTDGRHYVQGTTPMQVNITAYGAAGQDIIGTYSGTLKDSTSSSTYQVSGQFKIRNE